MAPAVVAPMLVVHAVFASLLAVGAWRVPLGEQIAPATSSDLQSERPSPRSASS